MILRELFYTDRTIQDTELTRYDSDSDSSPLKRGFTRRTRLSLKQINQARRADEIHAQEKQEELDFVRQMYGIVAQSQMAGDDMGGMGGM